MTVRHPGISPTNDLVAKKIFSNPEITCQFIRDMLDLPAKNVTILEGSNIHVLPSLPYSAQNFYTSIDVLAQLLAWCDSLGSISCPSSLLRACFRW